MAIIKLGEALQVSMSDLHSAENVLHNPDVLSRMADDSEMLFQFRKCAAELKHIAPKAKDFLYFSAIMMHAAEAALLDGEGGLKKDASGGDLASHWEKKADSWRWMCTDPSIKPYKNSNNDIFPEEELIKAHKKWVGRPLCLDHKSSSVDMIRGVIVDTYYDYKHKRVVALCALDKVNYPDLARKVATGYATSVSMGTAVGKAICTDCGQVAKVEADFCDHMRKKSCYGEINIDLNPIELSIVVNGADPQAKIRHIVAAADSIAKYVDAKKEQLSKLAEDETKDIELASKIEEGLEKAMADLAALKTQVAELKGNEQAEQKNSKKDEGAVNDTNHASFYQNAKDAASKFESMQKDLNKLRQEINKLSSKNDEETEMTTKNAYFQGAGGPNEPTPGKPKYEKEDEDSIRANQDKQMGGQMNTGPVEGMHPGYDSFGESEEARKKRLLRASVEERELRRQAALKAASDALQKGAYLQGGGGANEPTPGKPKYPKEDSDKIRNNEDKQLNGAPPFPGVGKLDGLYDKDLETKKKLLRAKLTAKFIKAHDLGESRWDVYADDRVILSATVDEITGKKAETLYSSIATKEFGRELLAKIKRDGFEKAASLFKGAQGAPMAPAAPLPTGSGLPGGDAAADPLSGMPAPSDAGLDKGKSGDPKETIGDISHQLGNLAADLAQANEALNEAPSNELQSFDELAGAPEGLPSAASTVALIGMQKKISNALLVGIKQVQAEIKDHLQELKLANTLLSDEAIMKSASAERKATINDMVEDACKDAKCTFADGVKLMGAFVKYARGTQTLVKRAQKELSLKKMAQDASAVGLSGIGDSSPQLEESLKALQPATPEGAKRVNPANQQPEVWGSHAKGHHAGAWVPEKSRNMYWDDATKGYVSMSKPVTSPVGGAYKTPATPGGEGSNGTHNMGLMTPEARGKALDAGNLKGGPSLGDGAATGITTPDATGYGTKTPGKPGNYNASTHAGDAGAKADDSEKDEKDMNDLKVNTDGSMDGSPEEVGKAMKEKEAANFDLNTKEGRAAYRTKLADKGLAFSDMLTKAHGKGGFTTQLDVKPTGDLAKVETLEETHKAMMDIANAPPKVRKQAAEIQKNVLAGSINPETDFPGLIANGIDPEAVKYWKSFWVQSKDGDFASDLVKDYDKKKVAEEKEAYKVKVARAYALAYEMAEKDIIGKDASSINTQVTEMLDWDDKAFNSLKSFAARQPVTKRASAIPQVGMFGDDVNIPAPEAKPSDMRSALDAIFAHKKY